MKTKPLEYCPECGIGLNASEMRIRFCQNCKCNWTEDDESEVEDEEDI